MIEELRAWVKQRRDELNHYFHDLNYLGTVVLPFKLQDIAIFDAILAALEQNEILLKNLQSHDLPDYRHSR